MKPTKLIGILLFLILSVTANAYEYEVTNEKTRLYSDKYYYDGKYHSDSGTIYAYAYMDNGKVKVKVKTKSGSSFNYDTAYYISKNSRDIRYKVASSPNMKGRSYYYVTFSPNEAEYYVVLATKTSSGKTVKFYIDTPIKVKKKATPKPRVSSVSFPTLTKDVRSKITINGSNLTSRTAFTISDAECSVSYSSSSRVYAYCTPRASGSKSWVVKDRSGGNALKRGTVSIGSPSPTVSSVNFPTLTKDVRSKITINGSNLTSRTAFTISDAECSVSYSSSSRVYAYCTPRASGSKSWVVKDRSGGNALKRGTVSIGSPSPTVSSVNFPTLTKDVRSKITVNGSNLTSRTAFTISDAECSVSYSSSSRVYAYCTPRASGSKSWVVKDRSGGNALKRGTVSIGSPSPTVSSVNFPTLTKDVRSKITVNGSNLTSRTAFTISDAECSVSYSSSSRVYAYCTPRASGSKSWVVKDRSGGNALKRGTVSIGSPSPTVSSVNFPTLTKDVRSKITINGSNLTSRTAFTISDAECSVSYSSSSRVYAYCTPRVSGSKSWVVKDRSGGNALKRGYITVNDISSTGDYGISPKNSVKVGEAFKLYYNSKNSLPSNYDVRISINSASGAEKLSGGQKNWYKNSPNGSKVTGSFKFIFKLYRDNKFEKVLGETTLTVSEDTTNFSEIINYLNRDKLIKQMRLSSNGDTLSRQHLSRSDAIILIDGMRNLGKSSINKKMDEYYNPFADVPQDAEYLPSLMRLAYYKSNFSTTTINKTTLFNPMRHTSREEFVKMVMNGFDIPNHSASLSSFSDRNSMSDWAKKYFETAVYNGIIVGNNGKLLAYDKISIKEALIVLRRIKDKFASNYSFTSSRYESPESLDLSLLYHKTIGFEYEPRYYKPNATPIDINRINISSKKKEANGNEYYELSVYNNSLDTSNGASDYYWWSTDKGYFKEEPSSSNYKKVRFYPMSTQPRSSYHITVNGGDNLGYVDSATKEIGVSSFNYPESTKISSGISANLSSIRTNSQLVANKLFTVDLTNTSVKKSNIELSIDQVTVSMIANSKRYELFHGTPNSKKARFIMGDYADLYGKDVKLSIEVYSQDKKYSTTKTIAYKPQFTVRGKVYNAVGGTKVTKVIVGSKEIALDENGEFFYTLDTTSKQRGLQVKTRENSTQNHFDPISIDLTYESPSKYVVLTERGCTTITKLKHFSNTCSK